MGLNNIYLSTNNGRILVIDVLTGKTKSTLKIDNEKISRPYIFNNGPEEILHPYSASFPLEEEKYNPVFLLIQLGRKWTLLERPRGSPLTRRGRVEIPVLLPSMWKSLALVARAWTCLLYTSPSPRD